jgi:hypothetical protein
MGRGIALQFKKVFPENFKRHKAICDKKGLQPGKMFIYGLNRLYIPPLFGQLSNQTPLERQEPDGGHRDRTADTGCRDVQKKHPFHCHCHSPLGCGLGGLRWADVRARIEA